MAEHDSTGVAADARDELRERNVEALVEALERGVWVSADPFSVRALVALGLRGVPIGEPSRIAQEARRALSRGGLAVLVDHVDDELAAYLLREAPGLEVRAWRAPPTAATLAALTGYIPHATAWDDAEREARRLLLLDWTANEGTTTLTEAPQQPPPSTLVSDLQFAISWHGSKVQVLLSHAGRAIHSDTCDPRSDLARRRSVDAIRKRWPAFDASSVEARLLEMAAAGPPKQSHSTAKDPIVQHDDEIEAALALVPAGVREAAESMLRSPNLVEQILADIRTLGVVGERELALSVYLTGTSRLLPKPIAAVVQGSSSSGKSHVIETVARMFPTVAVFQATDFTANALYYVAEGALCHRFVVAGERSRDSEEDERAEVTRALREMLAAGILRKALPEKDDNGQLVTRVIERRGPVAFVESTTLADFFEEDKNRMLLFGSDDSAAQTRRILTAAGERYARGATADEETRAIIARHHAAQLMLRRVSVTVPYAEALAAATPDDRPEARRAVHLVMAMCQASATLHQLQRAEATIEHGTAIEAQLVDYVVARRLLVGPLGRALGGGLPEHVLSAGRWILGAMHAGRRFTVGQLLERDDCRWSRRSLYDHVRVLREEGVLAADGSEGRSTIYRVAGPLPEAGATWLPSIEALGAQP